jgi:NAD(P)-dependent dehydrogenase (short-subunit alcohol dehydrogenase family)
MASNITLVVGASRGIGRELVHQLSQQANQQVIASTRKPAADLADLDNIQTITLDLADPASIAQAASEVAEIDTLIINAAIGDNEQLLSTSAARLNDYLSVNVTGPLTVVQAFLPALKARKTRQIVIISSTSGSMQTQIGAKRGFMGPYAVSKGALNMVAIQLHNELHYDEGFTVVPMHPGWVATDMGNVCGPGAMPIPTSAEGILRVVGGLTYADSAKFYNWDGSILPW